eukprot:5452945-Pleurochrysis_carterae.AAC.3
MAARACVRAFAHMLRGARGLLITVGGERVRSRDVRCASVGAAATEYGQRRRGQGRGQRSDGFGDRLVSSSRRGCGTWQGAREQMGDRTPG